MAYDPKFSLSEEAFPELENFFGEAVEEAVKKTLNVFQELAEINSQARYQIVIKQTREFAEHYMNEFQTEVLALFDSWRDEGESIHAFIMHTEAGEDDDDESVRAADDLEENMRNLLVEALGQQPELYEGSDRVALTEYGGAEKLFADIQTELNTFSSEMEDLIGDVESTAENEGEDNQIYMNIGGVLSSVLTAYKTFFDSFEEGISSNLSEHVSDTNADAMSSVEADKEQLKGGAEQVGEMLKEVASLFQF